MCVSIIHIIIDIWIHLYRYMYIYIYIYQKIPLCGVDWRWKNHWNWVWKRWGTPRVMVLYWVPLQIWCCIISWLPCLLSCSLLIEFEFNYNAITCFGCLAPSCGFFLNPCKDTRQWLVVAAVLPPVAVAYWIPAHIWCNMPSWLPCLLLWSFLIDFLFKSYQNPLLAALLQTYQHPLLAALVFIKIWWKPLKTV